MAYTTTDMQTVAYRAQDMMRDTGANAVDQLATQVTAQDQLATQNQTNRAMRGQIELEYDQNLQYQKNTDLLAQLNESWNTNKYLVTNVKSEATRINKLDNQARRDIYMFRHKVLYADYTTRYYNMMSGILVLALYTTLLLLLPAAMWRANRLGLRTLYVIDGTILLLFLIVLVCIVARFATRSNDVWKQRRWTASKSMVDQIKTDQQSCAPTDEATSSTP